MTTKKTVEPSLEDSRKLYEAASRIKELAPWQWMEEPQLFGVQSPETGELGFISVMGMAGAHFAISVYRGAEGLYGFWEMEEAGPFADPQMLLEIPQLQASFEDRTEIQKRDRDLMKKLGLKFRGAKAWPLFRSYTASFMPWYLTADETRFLTCMLEQTLEVSPRIKANPDILWGKDDSIEGEYLVRVASRENNKLIWQDQMMQIAEPEPPPIPIMMDMEALEFLKNLPPSQLEIEVDFFTMPTPVQDKGGRPYFPSMLMLVESSRGLILGFEMMRPEETREKLWGLIPATIVQKLAELGAVPKTIYVASEMLADLLQVLQQGLPSQIQLVDELPGLEEIRDSMSQLGGLW